jgi:hypothetical protein
MKAIIFAIGGQTRLAARLAAAVRAVAVAGCVGGRDDQEGLLADERDGVVGQWAAIVHGVGRRVRRGVSIRDSHASDMPRGAACIRVQRHAAHCGNFEHRPRRCAIGVFRIGAPVVLHA